MQSCSPKKTVSHNNDLNKQMLFRIRIVLNFSSSWLIFRSGATKRYHVVRVRGPSAVIHDSVKKFSLDSQVEAKRRQGQIHRLPSNPNEKVA